MSIDYCAACWERHADRRICHVNVGFLQEADQWAVGSPVKVTEISCHTLDDPACRHRIILEQVQQVGRSHSVALQCRE